MCPLLTNKREVNMTEYWPLSERSWGQLKQQNQKLGQYPVILTEQAWSTKDLLYGQRDYFVLRDRCGAIPSGQDLARSAS